MTKSCRCYSDVSVPEADRASDLFDLNDNLRLYMGSAHHRVILVMHRRVGKWRHVVADKCVAQPRAIDGGINPVDGLNFVFARTSSSTASDMI